jgi:acetyltransferase-like isoleucine patch superfamily enzyme
MRREHHPFWVEQALGEFVRVWAEWFLVPQFDRLGKEPRFQGQKWIHVQGPNIRAGDNLHVFATQEAPVSLCVNPYDGGNGRIDIGHWCVLSSGTRIRSAIGVEIGDNCMFAENCFITDADWHDVYHRIFPGKKEPVRIGNNVWIGDRVTVCKGVTIGDNSVIGAASVVTRDIPPNTIAAGNPARPIGELDPTQPSSRREHLFVGGQPYDDYKADYDRRRLRGNTLGGWLRALAWPDRDT